ncbi:MAG TPA: hypothetical protein PLI18_05430, partial [Pirellulaceae bacterium]|nr:hypothetical protein [Pirellulaceae bacterium]
MFRRILRLFRGPQDLSTSTSPNGRPASREARTRLEYQELERRRVLDADFSLVGNQLQLDNFSNDFSLVVDSDAADVRLTLAAGEVWNGVDGGGIAGNGLQTLTIDKGLIDGATLTSLLIDGASTISFASLGLGAQQLLVDIAGGSADEILASGDDLTLQDAGAGTTFAVSATFENVVGAVNLEGNVAANDGSPLDLTFDANVVLLADATITGNDLIFRQDVSSDVGQTFRLIVQASDDGADLGSVELTGGVGATDRLGRLEASADGGAISLGGTFLLDGNSAEFLSDVILVADTTINEATGDVRFHEDVFGDADGTRNLVVNAVAGNVVFGVGGDVDHVGSDADSAVTGTLASLDVTAGASITVNAAEVLTTGLQDYQAGVDLTLAGDTVEATAGNISLVADRDVLVDADVLASGNNRTITATGDADGDDVGGVRISTGGSLFATGTNGAVTISGADLFVTATAGDGVLIANDGTTDQVRGAGAVNITASSTGNAAFESDAVIDGRVTSTTGSITLNATRDVLIGTAAVADARVSAGNDVTATGDTNNDGSGGVLVAQQGSIVATDAITLAGADVAATAGVIDGVQIANDGTNDQLTAGGAISLTAADANT